MLALCRQFGQLPSVVLAEDAELLRMLRIEAMGGGPDDE